MGEEALKQPSDEEIYLEIKNVFEENLGPKNGKDLNENIEELEKLSKKSKTQLESFLKLISLQEEVYKRLQEIINSLLAENKKVRENTSNPTSIKT